ncbi:Protein toll [Apis cerana cerana]|uniref:Protein toll n=1 Tax=Apis cerana cerana TaxID=94128 RepID=A0A2A3EJK2_APICC|nr:Protein toll [Apis cerana cerana]
MDNVWINSMMRTCKSPNLCAFSSHTMCDICTEILTFDGSGGPFCRPKKFVIFLISVNLFEESQFTSPFIDKPISKKRRVYKDRATKDAGRHDGSRRIELYSSIHEVEFQSRSRRRDRAKDVEYRNVEPIFKSLTSIHKTNPLPAMHRNSVEPVAIRTQNQDVPISCRRKDPRTAHAARRGPSCVMLITSTRGTASDDDTVSLDDPRDKMSLLSAEKERYAKTIHVLWCTTNKLIDEPRITTIEKTSSQMNPRKEPAKLKNEDGEGCSFQSDSFNNHLTDNRVEVAVASRVINITAISGFGGKETMMEWEDIETRRIASSVRGANPWMALNRKFHEGARVRWGKEVKRTEGLRNRWTVSKPKVSSHLPRRQREPGEEESIIEQRGPGEALNTGVSIIHRIVDNNDYGLEDGEQKGGTRGPSSKLLEGMASAMNARLELDLGLTRTGVSVTGSMFEYRPLQAVVEFLLGPDRARGSALRARDIAARGSLQINSIDRHIFIHSFQNRSIATTTTAAHGPKAELLDCSETNFRCAEIARSTIKQRRQPNEGARPLIIASSAGFDVAIALDNRVKCCERWIQGSPIAEIIGNLSAAPDSLVHSRLRSIITRLPYRKWPFALMEPDTLSRGGETAAGLQILEVLQVLEESFSRKYRREACQNVGPRLRTTGDEDDEDDEDEDEDEDEDDDHDNDDHDHDHDHDPRPRPRPRTTNHDHDGYDHDGDEERRCKGTIFGVLGASLSKALRYKAPDECKWVATGDTEDDVSLVCRLRTINSELENTNFSVIQPQHTVRLRLECSDALFYQSSLSAGSFRPLVELRELVIEYCKIGNLSDDAFKGLKELRNLTVRTHNTDWSAMALDVSGGAFTDELKQLEKLDLGENNMWSIPEGALCPLEIHLRNNTLNVLPPGLFTELTQLLVLDLSHNELTAEWVNAATFVGLVRLVVLDLSNNRIARLDPAVFRDLYSLQILRLQENLLESLPENTFSALYNLHTLLLSYNLLTVIDATTLSGLYVLNLLSLDNNRLHTINPAALRNASSLQEFHLNRNQLESVPDALKATPLLRTLDLGENLISEIPSGTFDHVSQLYGLRLTENHIGNLSKGVFDRIKELKILNLAMNRIQYIEPGTFDENANLQAIRLDGNQLTDIAGLFTNLSNLVWLNVSDNKLRWFDYAMIPTGLQWLDIHSNEIRELGNYFEIESQLNLSIFDASENKLTEITGNAIPMSVERLYLNDNQISKVQSYSFFKKPNLTTVELKGNQIRNLEPYALRISAVPPDKPLPEFYIGDNQYLCDCTMEWLQRVNRQNQTRVQPRVMDLESIYCKLLYDREHAFVPLVEASHSQFLCKYDTHCFALCHCCDFDACDCEMTCPSNCTCYHDQSWSANVVDCSNGGHANKLPDQIPMDATRLYLDGNDLRLVSSHAFIGRKKLKVLFLNASNIEIVQNRSFNGLRDLEDLHLQDNKIRELKGHEFEGLDALRLLYLHRNRISSIGNDTFSTLRSLRILRLEGNRLTVLAVWTLPDSIEISLSGNPWSCECDYLRSYREWIREPSVRVTDASALRCVYNVTEFEAFGDQVFADNEFGFRLVADGRNEEERREKHGNESTASCTGAASVENDAHRNLTKTIIEKQVLQDYLPLLVTTLVASSLVVLLCLLGFVFRQELRVWFHSRFGVRIFYRSHEVDRDDRDKLFDAFISYSSKDEAFVAEELAPVLEMGNPSYKLCLHYRDFPVGSFIADTIVQAVESSRRTIMVLSENFIKSEWCRFDFKSAHHQVLRDRRRRLILVLVGDVHQRDLDPDIRLYLKTNTYLQWGDKLFWEKLRFALPDVPNNQRTTQRTRQPPPVRRQHNNRTSNGSRTVSVHI